MVKKVIYEAHPRDYTIVGISEVARHYCTSGWKEFNGQLLDEFINVIENGKYIYYVEEDGLNKISQAFIRYRLNKNKVDLLGMWKRFDKMVDDYFSLIKLPYSKYSKYMLLDFYDYYIKLLGPAYTGAYALEYIDEVKPSIKKQFTGIAKKFRDKGELIYKDGESRFIPKYLKWLSKKELPQYTPELMQYISCNEMKTWLLTNKGLPSPKELRSRKKLFVLKYYPDDKFQIMTGQKAKKYLNNIRLMERSTSGVKKMTGTTGYPGVVKGVVKIVRYQHEMKGFKNGQVLVSPMTQPSFLTVMKKASAFITEEGGTLSHAAIVARELKKPCVLGTKVATKVLRNGDRVTVNATTGTVNKL